MGLASDGGNAVSIIGTDGKEYVLHVLSMKEIAQLSGVWMGRLRERFKATLKEMGATMGQQLMALRDFEQNEPSFADTCAYAITAAGIDDALKLASGLPDVDVLGGPWVRRDLASQVLGLTPINPRKVESLADPTSVTPPTEGG